MSGVKLPAGVQPQLYRKIMILMVEGSKIVSDASLLGELIPEYLRLLLLTFDALCAFAKSFSEEEQGPQEQVADTPARTEAGTAAMGEAAAVPNSSIHCCSSCLQVFCHSL